MAYEGARVELFDGTCQGTITAIPVPNFWLVRWDDGTSGAVHPLDVRFLGGFDDDKFTPQKWAADSRAGEVCGIMGCLAPPVVRCAHCQNMYCEEHRFVLTTSAHPQK